MGLLESLYLQDSWRVLVLGLVLMENGIYVLSEAGEMDKFLGHWERKWQSQGWISGKRKRVPKVLPGISRSPSSLAKGCENTISSKVLGFNSRHSEK